MHCGLESKNPPSLRYLQLNKTNADHRNKCYVNALTVEALTLHELTIEVSAMEALIMEALAVRWLHVNNVQCPHLTATDSKTFHAWT